MDKLLFISLCVLSIQLFATVSSQQICQNKACQCQGNQVFCQCNGIIQDITINSSKILPNNCNLVDIDGCRNVFIRSTEDIRFEWLQIRNVKNFRIFPESTVRFANLTLSHVSNADIAPKTMSRGNSVQRIHFDRVNFTSIQTDTFRSSLDLEYLYFEGCFIKKIQSLALNDPFISTSKLSQLEMVNCIVDEVEDNAIRANALTINIMNNQFKQGLKQSSLLSHQVNDFGFLNNQVQLLEENSIDVQSSGPIRIENNRIYQMKTGAFRKIHYQSINPRTSSPNILVIKNNEIVQLEGLPFVVDIKSFVSDDRSDCRVCSIEKNRLPCGCDILRLYENEYQLYRSEAEKKFIDQILSNPCLDNEQLDPRELIDDSYLRTKQCSSSATSFTVMNNVLPIFLFTYMLYFLI